MAETYIDRALEEQRRYGEGVSQRSRAILELLRRYSNGKVPIMYNAKEIMSVTGASAASVQDAVTALTARYGRAE